ncbi:unnamed protein product [Phytophthora lilii]|uniref:Unnamed protein product n=1 Tax=Phytophthora lilii TaxID=2077276 RepID=A0A9W6X793_9STRA|nr:unnamed protein product [Phytophthora lilii]
MLVRVQDSSEKSSPQSSDAMSAAAIPLDFGIIDYVIVVGTAASPDILANLDEAQVLFRYPPTDRPDFPLPTKIEWFCFPGGPEFITQCERPKSKLFSFVLVGGNDGLCRCYVVCLVTYHCRKSKGAEVNVWHSSCLAFLTRIPVIEAVTKCLLSVAHAWVVANKVEDSDATGANDRFAVTRKQIVRLCRDIILPVRGVFGVQFDIDSLKIRLTIPSMTSIYSIKEPARPELRRAASAQGPQISPLKAKSFIAIQQGFQPLVYSLEPIFQLFDIKTIIHLVMLVLCEYRILVHSTQQSLLCPVTEGLCALIHPFRWQHPYVPILPRVLSEYLQAPLPYILGIHSSWLQSMLEGGRPEHLVLVDIDRGTIQLQESGGPVLPHKLTKSLHRQLKSVLHPSLGGEYSESHQELRTSIEEEPSSTEDVLEGLKQSIWKERGNMVEWGSDTEKQVRMEFVCYLAALVRGYRECLFFVNQKLPVFNKRRFFESESTDNEVVPLVTRLFSTQAFQAFLESHSSAELSVFHSVYLTLCRGPKEMQWSHSIRALSASKSQHSFLDTGPARTDIPVLLMEDANIQRSASSDDDKICSDDKNVEETPRTTTSSFNEDEVCMPEKGILETLGKKIETLLSQKTDLDPFALDIADVDALSTTTVQPMVKMNHELLARKLGVDPKLLKSNAHLLQNPHQVNQYRLHLDSTVAAALAGSAGPGGRFLSLEDERIEQMLHKCLTAVFTSDETLSEEEIRIEAANQVDPTESDEDTPETVEDELFFSVIGSLMYDMLNFEVPLQKVLTFVTVMCSTYQKGQDLLNTLKQLAENVYRALDMSKDIKPSPPKDAVQHRINVKPVSNPTTTTSSRTELPAKTASTTTNPPTGSGMVFAESPMLSREYDLNTVIRRKMSVREMPPHSNPHGKHGRQDDDPSGNGNQTDWASRTPPIRRRRSSTVFPSAVLASTGSPVLCLATDNGRASCGLADARVNVVDIDPSEDEKGVRLDGHTDAVVAVQMRGNALVSGSRDHTLRAWDLRATPKKRNMFAFFSLSYGSTNALTSTEDSEVDGTSVSKRSLVMRGHLDAITCMELGHQLGSGRALLVSGSDDGTVRLWETTRETSVGLLSGHKGTNKPTDSGGVSCLRLLSSDDDLALGYRRRTLQIWDLAVCKLKVSVQAHHAGITDLQVSGTRLVTAANDRVVKVWDTVFRGGMLQPIQELREHGGPVRCSSTALSPPESPASSLPSVYSPGSMVPAHENRPKAQHHNGGNAKLSGTQNLQEEDFRGLNNREGAETVDRSSRHAINSWPVLVAVRCRPRKRQHAKGRFAAALSADEEVRHHGIHRSSSRSSSSSSSDSNDDRGTNYGSSSRNVHRGVLEYSACREYDFAATYDAKLPPPRVQRPRRLHIQAPANTTGTVSGRRSFDFDFIFPPWKKQRDLYDGCVEAQVRHVLQSNQQGQQQHATVVAYGQTGTGKTYTMGMLSDFTDDKEQGLIPRALSQILQFAANVKSEAEDPDIHDTVVTMSFLQIYLETIQDLLVFPGTASGTRGHPWRKHDTRQISNSSSGDLPVRQGRDGSFYVAGLNEYEISSIEDAHALLELAMRNRVLPATTKNKTSSRSHTLLTISVKQRHGDTIERRNFSSENEDEAYNESDNRFENDESKLVSTISFVDLAGSERVDGALHFLRATRTRQEQRIREAKFINRSLSALGGVIAALAQPKISTAGSSPAFTLNRETSSQGRHLVEVEQGHPHIRFRDSQLTKLLQGRLMGGRGRLLLIATVDDQPKNLSETLSTLKFAAQCRRVELQPGSRLHGERASRLRRQKSLLDQVFNDMKIMHENREAALHVSLPRIEVLERELESARAAAQASLPVSPQEDAPAVYLASYTALCSLVDTICCSHTGDGSAHPCIADFRSERDMFEYVASLYSQLKEVLGARVQPNQSSLPAAMSKAIATKNAHQHDSSALEPGKQTLVRESVPTTVSTSIKPTAGRNHLSPEQEAAFRVVARHLISTHALDSFVVSSSDED